MGSLQNVFCWVLVIHDFYVNFSYYRELKNAVLEEHKTRMI